MEIELCDFSNSRWKDNILVESRHLVELLNEVMDDVRINLSPFEFDSIELESFSFEHLGAFIGQKARHYHYKMLLVDFSSQATIIYELALKYNYLSSATAIHFFKACVDKSLILETEEIKNFYNLDLLKENKSLIDLTCDYISFDSVLEAELDELFPDVQESYEHVFGLALGSYWLNLANSKIKLTGEVDLNLIGQGLNAYEFSHGWWGMGMGDSELSEKMSQNAKIRLEKDPKQKALRDIEHGYQNQKTQFKRRGFTAQFIRDMHIKYPIITDQKTIAKLVAKLNKENEHIPH